MQFIETKPNRNEEKELNAILKAVRRLLRSGPARKKLDAISEVYYVYIIDQHCALPTDFIDTAQHLFALTKFLKEIETIITDGISDDDDI